MAGAQSCRRGVRQLRRFGIATVAATSSARRRVVVAVAAQQNTARARAGRRACQLRPGVQLVLFVRERDHREDPEGRQGTGRAGGRRGGQTLRVQSAFVAVGRRKQNESEVSESNSSSSSSSLSSVVVCPFDK